jgi:hypothetical protein
MAGYFVNATVGNATYGGNQRTIGCLLDAAGKLVGYGDNSQGQFGSGPMPTAVCGNLSCELGENASSCPGDCGSC